MKTAPEALRAFEANGGKVWLDSGQVKVKYPEKSRQQLAPTLDYLRNHRQEILALLEPGAKSRPPSHAGLRRDSNHHDPYRQNAQHALERISRRCYHPETMNWLPNAHPLLYRSLTKCFRYQLLLSCQRHTPGGDTHRVGRDGN